MPHPVGKKRPPTGFKKGPGDKVLGETISLFAEITSGSDPSVVADAKANLDRELEMLKLFSTARPSSWERMSERLRAQYLQLALHRGRELLPIYRMPVATVVGGKSLPDPITYSWDLNLSKDVEARAMTSKAGPLHYLRRRLLKRLPHPKSVPFWFAIEFTESGRLHIHGGFACTPSLLDGVRRALYRVAGDVGNHKQFALELKRVPDTLGGLRKASYAAKDLARTYSLTRRKAVATTHAVIREARRLQEEHRHLLLKSRNRSRVGGVTTRVEDSHAT